MTADVPPPPTREARPDVPVLATLVAVLVGAAMLAATCLGAAAFGLADKAESRIAASAAGRAQEARTRAQIDDAKAALETLAARIAASARAAGGLPETLDEAPPADPWGRPIEYVRVAPDHGVLRSAGPDRKFGTKDDVRREVDAR